MGIFCNNSEWFKKHSEIILGQFSVIHEALSSCFGVIVSESQWFANHSEIVLGQFLLICKPVWNCFGGDSQWFTIHYSLFSNSSCGFFSTINKLWGFQWCSHDLYNLHVGDNMMYNMHWILVNQSESDIYSLINHIFMNVSYLLMSTKSPKAPFNLGIYFKYYMLSKMWISHNKHSE